MRVQKLRHRHNAINASLLIIIIIIIIIIKYM